MKPLSILNSAIVRPGQDPQWQEIVPRVQRSRTPRIWQMAFAAAHQLLHDNPVKPKSIISATALGALDETKSYLDGVFKDGFGSPRNFIASVHNSMAGKLAMDFGIAGPNLTVCDGQNSFASALTTASILDTTDLPVLLVVVDENIELLKTLIPHLSPSCKEFLKPDWQEAAVAFLLDSTRETSKLKIRALGPQPVGTLTPQQKCSRLCMELPCASPQLLPLSKTSYGFTASAIAVCECIAGQCPGTYCVGSYSPSSSAAAVVSLCI